MIVYTVRDSATGIFVTDIHDIVVTWSDAAPAYIQAYLQNLGLPPGDRTWEVQDFSNADARILHREGVMSLPESDPLPDPPPTPLYSQRDPRWINTTLGAGYGKEHTTIGMYGCVVTALAMGLSRIAWLMGKRPVTPDAVNQALADANGFTGSNKNLVNFVHVVTAYPELVARFDKFTFYDLPAETGLIDSALSNNDLVLIKVDMSFSKTGIQPHYLLVVGGDSSGYICHDPWPLPANQSPATIPPAYSKPGWDAARAIYAIVTFEKVG